MTLCYNVIVDEPRILSLTIIEAVGHVAFKCTSTESPATTVTWLRDGTEIQDAEHHVMEQYLIDGRSSTYDNLLIIPNTMILSGMYSCNVSNILGVAIAHLEICKLCRY